MDRLGLKFKTKANIGYVVAGYPSLNYTKELLKRLDDSALDILELGVPYSDPLADGKVIASASFSAASSGVSLDNIFDMLISLSPRPKAELVFLVYYNSIYAYGIDEFVARSKQAGVAGFIVPDLPFEEAGELLQKCYANDLALVPLISPTSQSRLEFLKDYTKGFVYLVGAIGVSGSARAAKERLEDMRGLIAKHSALPVAVGFGVRDAKDVAEVKGYADGAIIGTAIVQKCDTLSPSELIEFINSSFCEN